MLRYLSPLLLLSLLVTIPLIAQEPVLTPVPIRNGGFNEGTDARGIPVGWSQYAGSPAAKFEVAPQNGALIIDDQDTAAEIGVVQSFDVKPNVGYEVSVDVKAFEGRSADGAFLQFRFLPSGQFTQVDLGTESTDKFETITARGYAPADTRQAQIYLYSHRETTPKVMVANVKVVSGVAPPPPPPPDPVPPVYDKLKDLHSVISLVQDGKANCSIVAGKNTAEAQIIQQAIEKLTGVKVPIIKDSDAGAAVPLTQNLIVVGNRNTNKTSSGLYDNYYSLLDLKYPGAGGYVIRSLHNPYGNGFSAVLVGGSDSEGCKAAAQAFAQAKNLKASKGTLSAGWLMETKLGAGVKVPTDLKQFLTWEDSKGYGNTGYFGWNSISKRMAMYYMTGDPFHAREAIRLAFPDAQATKELEEIDGERIENKHDPLAGPYHYNAMMLILYWDLIEESPVFTDEERLKVTNSFARRLAHPQDLGTYKLDAIPSAVGSRHGQWSAMQLYTLGRYFNKYYPSPLWAHAERAGKLHFASLHKHAWVNGEADNLYWYSTGTAPLVTYLVMTGDRKPLENGVLAQLLKAQEVLISGRVPDWALNYAALDYLLKTAYLTNDGRWLTYLQRTQQDTDTFRLGQSFWPDESLTPSLPNDLANRWTINQMPKPMWVGRGNGFTLDQSFLNGSFRSAPDASGDYVLLDGYNGASRNPYHTYDILELRLNGRTLLQGYANQVLTSADGMVSPIVPMDGALLYSDVLGTTAVAVGEVPKMPFASWRRSLAQRTGRYCLIADDLRFGTDSQNMKVSTSWELQGGAWNAKERAIRFQAPGSAVVLPGWVSFRAVDMKCRTKPDSPDLMAALDSLGIMILRAREADSHIEMPFKVTSEIAGEAFVDFLNYTDRGVVQCYLDGKPLGEKYDNYAEGVTEGRAPLGKVTLTPGEHVLRVTTLEAHPGNDRMFVGLKGLSIKTSQAMAGGTASFFELRPSDVQETTGGGTCVMNWVGGVKKDDRRVAFYLLGQNTDKAPAPLACLQIAPNAAALSLPTPAVAVAGEYQGLKGELLILAADHLTGHNLTLAGVMAADKPVNVDWDFAAGTMDLVTTEPTRASFDLEKADGVQMDGKPVQMQKAGLMAALDVPAGRHALTGLKPAGLGKLQGELANLLAAGATQRQKDIAAASVVPAAPPAWAATGTANIGGRVSNLITINSSQGKLVATAADNVIHLLTPTGQAVRRFNTDGKIRTLYWWDKPRLLLAGCVDEKLIAFDEQGNRKWVFISEMDPAVYEAAKTYWFKSAPGHEGVHGLFAGQFLDGKEQCFVGGACTLEIVDENGKLVKRMPAFWGPGAKFNLIPRADGSIDLLFAKEPTDSHSMYILNNRTMQLRRAFDGVPSGHTYVGGWANMSRDHIFHADLDADGKQEIVSEINGAWNRITVWNEDGAPLYNAQFGPGNPIPYRNMRDVDLVDLNGDGKIEIITATSQGLVVALNAHCEKVWSTRLTSPATVLKTVAQPGKPPTIVVACENGSVLSLDAQGSIQKAGQLGSAATKIELVQTPEGPLVLLGGSKGEVAVFQP
ncbi:MAG: hypothetical protein ABFE07_05730 [Armatimonadia bacterium]